jgi:hypothetical protein
MARTGAAGGLHGCVRDRRWEAITVRAVRLISTNETQPITTEPATNTQYQPTPCADGAAPWVVVRDSHRVPPV